RSRNPTSRRFSTRPPAGALEHSSVKQSHPPTSVFVTSADSGPSHQFNSVAAAPRPQRVGNQLLELLRVARLAAGRPMLQPGVEARLLIAGKKNHRNVAVVQ